MIEFTYPYLFLLLPLPLLLRRFLPFYRTEKPAIRAPFFDDLSLKMDGITSTIDRKNTASISRVLLLALCWLLLLIGLVRPQYIEEPLTKTIATRDLLLAVDLSTSMDTKDFKSESGEVLDRLAAVKEVLDEFLEKREGDRVGLIVFGMAPFVQVPFTEDLNVCRVLLNEAQVGMAGPQTMIGDAIGLGITIFENSDLKDKVLILLTDGNDTGSRIPPEEAAKVARDKGIVIHTVAVGDPTAAGESQLDEASLKAISKITKGAYFWANDRGELEEVYETLDEIDTREIESISYRPKRDLFYWPLALLLLISFVSCLVEGVRIQRRAYKGDGNG
jgi:Ca-activated chloride channel family protein